MPENTDNPQPIEALGVVRSHIQVGLTARFLEHFSEQLYSSPNKAFEELIANSWDANARTAYIYLPPEPALKGAAIYVLDDGDSMNDKGLEDLWKVAYSAKIGHQVTSSGRAMIGKFGIGKLATYVLANKLTYVCKAPDGIIRTVTMDYSKLDSGQHDLIRDLSLDLREVSKEQLQSFLLDNPGGAAIYDLIERQVPPPEADSSWDDEFAAPKAPSPQTKESWTLVVLSSLKPQGKQIKTGIVRRMIQTSLPLGAELKIVLNNELLASAKTSLSPISDLLIGPELGIQEIELPAEEGDNDEGEKIKIDSLQKPFPQVQIPGLGPITGRVKLYFERISGGKSEEHGPSNGFFVNVRGRITNSDPHFGEKDLSHSAWARFRMTVRADGLNDLLAVNREQFTDRKELRVFKAFLRACFNKMRTEWEKQDKWSDSGKVIVESYGTLPLLSLKRLIEETLSEPKSYNIYSSLIDISGIHDLKEGLNEFQRATKNDAREVLKSIEFEELGPSAPLSLYSLKKRSILINRDHPFAKENSEDRAQKESLKDSILINFLIDGYTNDLGLEPTLLAEIRQKREGIARQLAKIRRRSGAQIASLLLEVSKHPDFRALEILVGDALEYLGFEVTRMGGSGKPEGICRAKLPPDANSGQLSYSFSYDAKSSQKGKAQTGNCNVAGLVRHRDDHGVNYILLVAPDFQEGVLDEECQSNQVTPMRASDLGKLLQLTAEYGAIPLTKIREVFDVWTPDKVSIWVSELETWLQRNRIISLGDFIATLRGLGDAFPEAVSVAVVADRCRQQTGKNIVVKDILRLVGGLQIIVPDLVQVEGDKIVINAHPNKLTDAVNSQIQKLRESAMQPPAQTKP
jgi:hypothetical protein